MVCYVGHVWCILQAAMCTLVLFDKMELFLVHFILVVHCLLAYLEVLYVKEVV